MSNQLINRIRWGVLASVIFISVGAASAGNFEKLSEAVTDDAKRLAVVFDFDTDSCYPSPAVSNKGQMNGGLAATGEITGECRAKEQLTNSNTYHRSQTVKKDGKEYAVHMYALYFMKDQWAPVSISIPIIGDDGAGGHRHDWEFALVWTTDGKVTHASCSAHGDVETKAKPELYFDKGKEENVKVVYHKDGVKTHSFRFAKESEAPENEAQAWFTPTLVDWSLMKGEGVTNAELQEKFNKHNFEAANCPFNDANFANAITKNIPDGYPAADAWKNAK